MIEVVALERRAAVRLHRLRQFRWWAALLAREPISGSGDGMTIKDAGAETRWGMGGAPKPVGEMVESKTLTLAQAEAIAATILPRDATRTAGPHTTPNGTEVEYCSAALIAAFPSDVQMSVAPLFHDGRIAVTYDVNSAGDVQLISFMEHVL